MGLIWLGVEKEFGLLGVYGEGGFFDECFVRLMGYVQVGDLVVGRVSDLVGGRVRVVLYIGGLFGCSCKSGFVLFDNGEFFGGSSPYCTLRGSVCVGDDGFYQGVGWSYKKNVDGLVIWVGDRCFSIPNDSSPVLDFENERGEIPSMGCAGSWHC
jgi:hypothetical protein